jgi:hypothetical protein
VVHRNSLRLKDLFVEPINHTSRSSSLSYVELTLFR